MQDVANATVSVNSLYYEYSRRLLKEKSGKNVIYFFRSVVLRHPFINYMVVDGSKQD